VFMLSSIATQFLISILKSMGFVFTCVTSQLTLEKPITKKKEKKGRYMGGPMFLNASTGVLRVPSGRIYI